MLRIYEIVQHGPVLRLACVSRRADADLFQAGGEPFQEIQRCRGRKIFPGPLTDWIRFWGLGEQPENF
jgi:hypothetical protein